MRTIDEMLTNNVTTKNIVIIHVGSYNAMRKLAGFDGPITQTELQPIKRPVIYRVDMFPDSVIIGMATFDYYRRLCGFIGEITEAEREIGRSMMNDDTRYPIGLPRAAVS